MLNQKRGAILTKIIILGIIVILIVLLGSILFSNYYLSKKIAEIESQLRPPQKEEITPESPKVTLPKVLYNLAGTIQKLEKNSLILEAMIPQVDETGQPVQKSEVRKVIVSPTTKVSRLVFITQEGTDRKVPEETPIIFGNLKIGDYIEVISNQDISEKQEFEVTQIRLLPKSF